MTVPVFEEYEPAPDCDCPGCVGQRRTLAAGGHPAAHGCRRALVLFTAAGVVLGGPGVAGAAQSPEPPEPTGRGRTAVDSDHEQGRRGPLYGGPLAGPAGVPAAPLPQTTRADIINRAKKWVTAKVPYSMAAYWSDGYRQDCSGYVSMAWNLARNEWTGSLAQYGIKITREELQPGDILLFHNPANPTNGSHVTIFGGWTDGTHTSYVAYEQAKPHTRKQSTPMAYWNNSDQYIPYRYRGVATATSGAVPADAYPGAGSFGPGAENAYVTRLGEMLIARGGKRFYQEGPGPRWGEADRKATEAFQLAQGWASAEADGLPGPDTWELLVTGTGKDIPAAQSAAPAPAAGPGGVSAAIPPYPGPGYFRPGQSSEHVTRLGRRLVERGYGRHYTSGPGPRWGEADRRNVEAFQRAQGWRGAAADGYPGRETWRRLFAPTP
ncbi:peptidoglycan-binding protein [Streptomyces sp. NPDC005953]|uniref:peptidoglycan-binding protein n=1 Tax=Streptomyces sp. NPDC005953 TaxID=3156719 RepID=UPI0033F23F0F